MLILLKPFDTENLNIKPYNEMSAYLHHTYDLLSLSSHTLRIISLVEN